MSEWNISHPGLLGLLLRMRQDMRQGRLEMHIGYVNAFVLVGFLEGYKACCADNSIPDVEFARFREWLRSRGEFPVEGWAEKYLRDCGGDHYAAIRKYLDFAAEFVALQE